MNQKEQIDRFLGSKKIALAGVSRNKNKFGSSVYRELLEKGMDIVPVNPNMETVEGNPCYRNIETLPDGVDALLCVVKPGETEKLVEQAHNAGIKNIWMQQGSESEAALAFCRDNGLSVVSKACILMYSDPVKSIHRFHRGLAKLFGRYHK